MPTKPHRVLGVAGLRTFSGGAFPRRGYDPDPDSEACFTEQVDFLAYKYGAATRPMFYLDEETDQVEQARGWRVNINPAWEGDGLADAPKDDAAWAAVTDTYEPVNPDDAFVPLADAIQDRGVGVGAFGAFTLYRNGGEVHADLFLPDMAFDLEAGGVERELVPGIQTGYDHFAQRRVYAEPVVLEPTTGTVLRHLAEKRKRRHVKPSDEDEGTTVAAVTEWWSKELDRLENLGDALLQTIQEARDYEMELSLGPFEPVDFYTAMGFPTDMAQAAVDLGDFDHFVEPKRVDAWRLFQAITYTLTEKYEGKMDGTAIRRHFRRANDILFRPPHAEDEALGVLAEREEAAQTDLNGDRVRDVIRGRQKNLAAAADEYRTLKDRLKALAEEAEPEEVPA